MQLLSTIFKRSLGKSLISNLKPKTPSLYHYRPLSVTSILKSHGEADKELCLNLKKELDFEKENSEKSSSNISEFMSKNEWKIQDTLGEKEVVLSKDFGNEKINIFFTCEVDDSAEEEDIEKNATIVITKPNQEGSLEIQTTLNVSQGVCFVEHLAYYEDAKLALENSVEA